MRDRATLFNLLIGLDGYTVCSGVIDSELNGGNIVAVPLEKRGYAYRICEPSEVTFQPFRNSIYRCTQTKYRRKYRVDITKSYS